MHATEDLRNIIVSTMDENERLLANFRDGTDDAAKLNIIDKISASNLGLFECCFSQDITGKRITRVVKALTYFEDRVTALIDARGKTEPKSDGGVGPRKNRG